LYDRGYKGIEFVGDYRLTKKYFWLLNLEMKTKPLMMTDSILQQSSYLKVGFDYNAYENWLDMENIISIGFALWFQYF
jgi:hypothetical protein